ncbi:restriction endonuclease subunit S [Burkholderia multivorans]|uniref:restriction endonuclease subunit S n=1 Tax=Burkholderia multivorans TaxID=87883 RepID=UPI0009BEB5A0|nr:restriction endonuclease subunit S [Burkholderia multivorans]MBU9256980.1 restriction endonuclease subunit S [Burkholderia multivorans]MDN7758238.1 restriction endonuclease subunit S [Burkholderia multivorans]MDN8102723.1 restriction endonuclease subunit S [Burkholderia multivorans]
MSLPTYSQYKDSGTAIVGAVPHHWQMKPVKAIASINDDVLPETTEPTYELTYVDIGSVSLGSGIERTETFTFKDAPSRARRLVRDGDVIISTVRTYLKAIASIVEPPENLVVSTGFAVVRPLDMITPGFAKYALQSPAFVDTVISRSTGVSYPAINASDLARIALPVPPRDEQFTIATFLDRETSKIDALIAEQEKLLELLAEKRQATISHAVTRGLNPDVPMKDSGVEWFEAVPEHWTVCTLRRVVLKIEQGWSPECDNRPADDGEWGVLKTGCVNGGVFNAAENKALPDALEPAPALEIRDGDLLMSRASGSPKLVGSAAYITNPPPRLILSDKIFRLHLRDWVVPRFLAATFTSAVLRSQIEKSISGAEGLANNLPQSNLKGFWIVVPPRKEQEEIVAFVDTETAKLDALKTDAERAIDLLKERRKALISAAVTGKIDVREHPSALAEAA